jgi:hypothetical protein
MKEAMKDFIIPSWKTSITDTRNNFVLEFLDYFVDPPRYTIQECRKRSYS